MPTIGAHATSRVSNCDLVVYSPHTTEPGMFLISISTPIAFQFCWNSAWQPWRAVLPAVVDMVNFILWPSFSRMPSAPTFQPASSSIFAASAGFGVSSLRSWL